MKKGNFNIIVRDITSAELDDYCVQNVKGYVTDDGFGIDKRNDKWFITDLYSGMSITALDRKQDCAMYLVKTKIPFERFKDARELGHRFLKECLKEN